MITFASDNSKTVADWLRDEADAIENGPQAMIAIPDKPEPKIAPLIPIARLQHPGDLPATHLKPEVEAQAIEIEGLGAITRKPSLAIVPGAAPGSQSALQLDQLKAPGMVAVVPVTDEDLSLYADDN